MDLLYKYVSAERVLTCLPEIGDGTLRATQPSALNDPFECGVAKVFVGENMENKFAKVLTDIHNITPVSETDVIEAENKYGSLFLRELFSKQLSQRFGVVSFASDPRHPLMWSHYAIEGSGFVVAYDIEQLKMLGDDTECLKPINYASKPAIIRGYPVLNEENIPKLMTTKSDHWSYEKEWRLILELNNTIGTGYTDRFGQPINLLRVPNKAVMKVYYTERTPDETVKKVQMRLNDANNRYKARCPIKLILSETYYRYEDERVV